MSQRRHAGAGSRAPEQQHGKLTAVGTAVLQEVGVRDARVGVLGDEGGKGGIRGLEDARDTAEVDLQPRGLVLVADGGEDVDVGAMETVDGLLGVADEEQPALLDRDLTPAAGIAVVARPGQQAGELDLQGVGVLKLVDHQDRPLVVQPAADMRVGAQHVAGQDEQIVVLQRTGLASSVGILQQPFLDAGAERLGGGHPYGGDDRLARLVGGGQGGHDRRLVETGSLPLCGLAGAAGDDGAVQCLQQVKRIVEVGELDHQWSHVAAEMRGEVVVGPAVLVCKGDPQSPEHLLCADRRDWRDHQRMAAQPVPGAAERRRDDA